MAALAAGATVRASRPHVHGCGFIAPAASSVVLTTTLKPVRPLCGQANSLKGRDINLKGIGSLDRCLSGRRVGALKDRSARRGFMGQPFVSADVAPLSVEAAVFTVGAAVVATAGVVTAMASRPMGGNELYAVAATRSGMSCFISGDVEGSLHEFDRARDLDPSREPYLWQRGLSLYYLGRYREAADQFRKDVAVNPNDTEEAIWCFLSEAMETSAAEARTNFLKVGRDPRPVMRAAYQLFQDGGDPSVLIQAAQRSPRSSEEFYALLYAGLFYESERDELRAREFITRSTQTEYAVKSGDYMAALARVHCRVRGWA